MILIKRFRDPSCLVWKHMYSLCLSTHLFSFCFAVQKMLRNQAAAGLHICIENRWRGSGRGGCGTGCGTANKCTWGPKGDWFSPDFLLWPLLLLSPLFLLSCLLPCHPWAPWWMLTVTAVLCPPTHHPHPSTPLLPHPSPPLSFTLPPVQHWPPWPRFGSLLSRSSAPSFLGGKMSETGCQKHIRDVIRHASVTVILWWTVVFLHCRPISPCFIRSQNGILQHISILISWFQLNKTEEIFWDESVWHLCQDESYATHHKHNHHRMSITFFKLGCGIIRENTHKHTYTHPVVQFHKLPLWRLNLLNWMEDGR